MSKRHAKRIAVRIDMTPMVDVAFLLLIFFMSTTQFKPPEEVAVVLPESSSEIKVPETGIIVITVNKSGKVFIGDESGQAGEVPKDDIMNAIVTARSRRPTARVIVKGDKDAQYGLIADVMDALQNTQTNRFNLMTELKTTSGPKQKEN
jgi:biopolymer transport protein ExbD